MAVSEGLTVSNNFHLGRLNIINLLEIFACNLKSLAQLFQVAVHVHPCHPALLTYDSKQFQCLKIVLNNKIKCAPEREGERTLGMRLEQTETETPVLYDKKTKEKAQKRETW